MSTTLRQARELRPPLISISDVLDFFATHKKTVSCLQVGANDGRTNDPIYPYVTQYGWRALLVEPQKAVFENELSKTYATFPNVTIANCAIAPTQTQMPLYRIAFSNARWATGLSSFEKQSLISHIKSGYVDTRAQQEGLTPPAQIEDYISTEMVTAYPPHTLLEKYNFKNLDAIVIDTEGYDFEILKMFDFQKVHPDLILFESKNLSNQDFAASTEMLKQHGYKVFWQKGDTLALSPQLASSLGWWRQLIYKAKAFLKKI